MNNNNSEEVAEAVQGEDVITCADFNEEDFDEGPGPGVYIPQATITKL